MGSKDCKRSWTKDVIAAELYEKFGRYAGTVALERGSWVRSIYSKPADGRETAEQA